MGGVNPRKMKQMMKQMGVSLDELEDVREVIIRMGDRELVFPEPTVMVMKAHGTTVYQLMGTPEERSCGPDISEEDLQIVMEKTGAGREEAREALESANGDLVEAIMKLGGE
ncbi:MAG: Nascent polypeptide-associated complex (NAC), archaeal [Candidatus Syntrophoarchaeum butanivorans]|nr:MAG: Nascent polypeptide-associated complex (NAC), archaeal [Candidatus Syntrophoarchaeum butanivorans]